MGNQSWPMDHSAPTAFTRFYTLRGLSSRHVHRQEVPGSIMVPRRFCGRKWVQKNPTQGGLGVRDLRKTLETAEDSGRLISRVPLTFVSPVLVTSHLPSPRHFHMGKHQP